MRYGLVEEGKCEFVLGLGLGGCLAIYRRSALNAIVERFREKQHMAQYQKFFTLFFSTLHQTECDKLGRTAIPVALRNAVGIKKGIVVAGVLDKIEIWPEEVYNENLQAVLGGESGDLSKMTEEAFALLTTSAPKPESKEKVLERLFSHSRDP
jgi:MraZ protein